ncbi:death domain-containing protein 1 [Rana temporaria]|uniref:death domain-containing protein 1 n=1 Tax=Rana temporaria TaxID=8407 RepID=UPI001AAC9D5C|nr:death domain-containing protein 1 [Rana temporaria]
MESLSTNDTNTEDQIHHLLLILTQIKQFNNHVEDVLEEASPKNKENVEELVFALIPLMQDLIRTFCEKINRTTETLKLTLPLLNRIQDTFQDLGSVIEPIKYICEVSQILKNAAKDLDQAKEQLNITIRNKDTMREDENSNLTDKLTSGETEGPINNKEIMCATESPELKANLSEKKKSLLNAQMGETDNTVISDTNDHCYKTDSKEETNQTLEQMERNNNTSLDEEQTYTVDGHMASNQELNDKTDHLQEYRGKKEKLMDISATEITLNGTTVNLSPEYLADSGNWTYKEYTVEVEGEDEEQLACFIKAPSFVLRSLKCRFIDEISSLVVSDGEELVSSVLNISSEEADLKIPFPISISIPFNSHYRGSYKDVMVKTIDEKLQASYLTPNSLDGYHGNHKGSFAEIKVYKLGTFSVISCLKKENFTVPRKGLSLKLSVDSRISLNYPPGCLSSSVIVQFKVQPIDTSLISLLKGKHDIYHPMVSSSPLIHMKQPSTQVFHKPVTVFLPCPPNPEKKKGGDDSDKRASSAAASKATGTHQIRAVSASVRKHGDNPSELLKLLALKEDQWIVLDDIVVKNVQNGIVSFEISEHLQSFIVVRLSLAMDAPHLIQFIHSLEFAIHSTMVNVVLYKRKDNFHNIIVELVPSKELNWEISALIDTGYTGPPEPSEAIALQEGDQIHFQFCGNISASDGTESNETYRLTFHSQKMHRISFDLSVVDEFGNYSSPHYKGTVAFYRVSKEDIATSYKTGLSTDSSLRQRTPVCKLPITLPKVEKYISRPSSTKLITRDPRDLLWDSVLKWLARELSEEDASELFLSLPIQRSTVQLVRLKNPDNLAAQVYELLSLWKKRLPTSTDKFRLLARHLNKSGRSDLVEQMKAKWESKISLTANR